MNLDKSAQQTINNLSTRIKNPKLLALGQTVFWDEPIKAILYPLFLDNGYNIPFYAGVHDTDYFGKLKGTHTGSDSFKIVAHNDGETKGLWSAAGEISALFGSETLVTRDRYQSFGIPFDKIADYYPGGKKALFETMTSAWGWRGLVPTKDEYVVSCYLPLNKIGNSLLKQLDWALSETYDLILDQTAKNFAISLGDNIKDKTKSYIEQNPNAVLTDLYKYLLPILYSILLEEEPKGLEITATSSLLNLKRETANSPRFQLVDYFLNPKTRQVCIDSYNHAVEGSEIYTLDKFGEGAIPFDLVLPDKGRGTVCVTEDKISVHSHTPFEIPLSKPIHSIIELAEIIEQYYPDGVPLVGKAVSFVSMLSSEFVFVFHEEGSVYVHRTRKMNQLLKASGIDLNWNPILRLHYAVWDSLSATAFWLKLPEHLANTFGQWEICSSSFSKRWQAIVNTEKEKLQKLSKTNRVRDIISYLQKETGGHWDVLADEYDRNQKHLKDLLQEMAVEKEQINELFDVIRRCKKQFTSLEKEKGDDFRAFVKPIKEQMESADTETLKKLQIELENHTERREDLFDSVLETLKNRIRNTREEIKTIRQKRAERANSPEVTAAHERRRNIERESQFTKMRIIRDAALTVEGLEHTNHRPTAWWIAMLCAKGCWFKKIAETTEVYLEELV